MFAPRILNSVNAIRSVHARSGLVKAVLVAPTEFSRVIRGSERNESWPTIERTEAHHFPENLKVAPEALTNLP